MQYQVRHTEHFNIFFCSSDELFATDIANNVEPLYNDLTATYLLPDIVDKYSLYICPSVQDYIEATNKTVESYEDWMVGWSDYRLKRICILSPRIVKDRTADEMKKIVVHEVTHTVFDPLCSNGNAALWLAEGIATLCAQQIDLNYVDESNCPNISGILTEDDFYDNGGYDYCGVYVWYFIKKYGIDAFKNVYTKKENIQNFLYPEFEKEAVASYKLIGGLSH